MASAIYAARKGIENFISVTQTAGHALAAGLEQHVTTYDVDIMNSQRAEALGVGDLIEVKLKGGASLKARAVIIATGARWREIDVPGEHEYRNRGVGGGNSGVEAAIDLAGLVSHVTLIEFDAQLKADAVLTRKLLSLANVAVITGAQTSEVIGDGQRVSGLKYQDRSSGEMRGLKVDARGQTSAPGVFAAGDCTVVPYKQIVIAMGEGAKASLSAFDHLIRQPVSLAA